MQTICFLLGFVLRKFLLLAFSPCAVILLFDAVFYYRPVLVNGCFGMCDGSIYFMLITDCVAFACLAYAASRLAFGKEPCSSPSVVRLRRTLAVRWYLFSLFSIIFLYGFLIYQVFGVLNPSLVFENYDEFYSMSSTGTAWVFMLFYFFCFLVLYDFYMGAGGVIKTSIFIMMLTIIAATGGRSIIVVQIMFILFLHVVINKKTVGRIVIGCASIFVIAVFVGNAFLRSGGAESYGDEAAKLDFDNSFILNDVINYVNSNGPAYFVSLDDIYYFFVPRAFDESKPLSTAETRLIYSDVAERGTNYTFGLYGNLYLNLGYIGLAFAPLVVVVLTFLYFRVSLSVVRRPHYFLVLFLTFYSIQFVRDSLNNPLLWRRLS